jgi:trans-aconitate methyltransferase
LIWSRNSFIIPPSAFEMSLITSAATRAKKDVRWNAADYAANSAAQHIWARDLIAQLHLRGDEHILDVGCGDGKVTAELARAVPKGSVTGIDASPEMIRFARKTFPPGKHSNLKFQVMDARHIRLARRFDVIFSSSVLHWVADHPAFLRGAAACLRPGGRLVVSCGGKGNAQDVFVALRPEMRLKQWCKFFRKLQKPYFFHSPAEYEKWLPRFDFKTHTVRLSPKDAVYQGRGSAPRGCLTRNVCRKICARSSPPASWTVISRNIRPTRRAAFASAWCGWKLTR